MRNGALTIALFLGLFFMSTAVYAAPSDLIANSISESEVELSWDTDVDDLGYDIWYSENGHEWLQINSETVTGSTYVVGDGMITPLVNYYFIVTNADAVQPGENPLDVTDSANYNGQGPNATDIAIIFSQRESVHGNYKKGTNACAKCHRTHSTNSTSLLITNTVSDTCITCHDGTQSKYDVLKGEVQANMTGGYLDSAGGPLGNLGFFTDDNFEVKVASYDAVTERYTVVGKPGPWMGNKASAPTRYPIQYWTKIYVVPEGEIFDKNIHWKDQSGKSWNEVLQIEYKQGYFQDNKNLIATGSVVYVEFPTVDKDDPKNGPDTIPDVMSVHSIGESVYYLGDALRSPIYDNEWGTPFGCGSCHYVHGTEYAYAADPQTIAFAASNYRMLRTSLPGNSDIRVLAFAETISGEVYGEKIHYKQGMNQFCIGCHADYIEKDTVSGAVYAKMKNRQHAIEVSPWEYSGGPLQTDLPLQGTFTKIEEYNKNDIMCLTCHAAHGSNSYRNTIDEPNFLLRANGENGVCVRCHTF